MLGMIYSYELVLKSDEWVIVWVEHMRLKSYAYFSLTTLTIDFRIFNHVIPSGNYRNFLILVKQS